MSGLMRRLDTYWMAPARRLALLRILIGGFALLYVGIGGAHIASVATFSAEQFEPVGLVRLLGAPLAAPAARALVAVTFVTGLAFVGGWRFRISGPMFAVLLLWIITYRNSWGQIFHTENLLVLHVAVLALAPSADALSLDARRRPVHGAPVPRARYGWPVRLMAVVTVLAYVIAAQTKLEMAGLDWITSDALRNQIAYDNLRKILLGDAHSPLGAALAPHGWLFPPLAGATIALELGAPLALLGGRAARVWAGGALLMHWGIFALMAIVFPYQMLGVAFLPFFAVERWRLPAAVRRRAPAPRPGTMGSCG